MTVEIEQASFGNTLGGDPVELFTFQHSNGLQLAVSNYGGVIQSLRVPDTSGRCDDVVLGYDSLAAYETDIRYLGCIVGRFANRIAEGRFALDGNNYQLETNPSGNHIHGGNHGFNKQVWRASIEQRDGLPCLVLQHSSPHGHGGYPGNVTCTVTYAIKGEGDIEISYHAQTDRPTIINLTNHSYFNLAGHQHASSNGVLDHLVQLNSDAFLPTDRHGIPVSAPVSVNQTPMDFRTVHSFAARIDQADTQLQNGNGYDHNWVVRGEPGSLRSAAIITDPSSGRRLEVLTTQPGIQVYTGNSIDELPGKDGMVYQFRGAVCLETQHYPDSPNWPEFPTTVLTPGEPLEEVTVYRTGLLPADSVESGSL